MIFDFETWTTDNDVDLKLTPQDSRDRALLRSLAARNARVGILRDGANMKLRFYGADLTLPSTKGGRR